MDKTNLTQTSEPDAFEDAVDEPCLYDEIMDLVNVRRDRRA